MTTTTLSPGLKEAFDKLVRGTPEDIKAYLTNIETSLPLAGTKANIHLPYHRTGRSEIPRIKDLAKFLSFKIIDYSIPRKEIDRAKEHLTKTGSAAKVAELQKKAASLFSSLEKSGEGGELLLYLLVEYFLQLPQVMCKMPLKTNSEVHYHGIDGIHASVDKDTNNLALYWGESKLYKDVNAAISACISSIQPFLVPKGGSGDPRERDLQLMRDNLDLSDPALETALFKYLDPDDPMYKKLEYRGACLIGFDHKAYPNTPNSKTEEVVCAEIKTGLADQIAFLKEQAISASLASFSLEVFFVPFPSVQEFRDAFAEEIGTREPPRSPSK
ncbi:MAG: DUF1837 domain-containing protein [Elusimicrobia bacterium]|nr:DUF1837 domain-containing protein [Elusimicrobiota bacterium]